MFCEKCGEVVKDKAVVCINCGFSLQSNTESDVNNEPLNGGVKVVSFCFPLVGAILFFVHQNSAPQKSKDACQMALWGVGLGFLINILTAIAGG